MIAVTVWWRVVRKAERRLQEPLEGPVSQKQWRRSQPSRVVGSADIPVVTQPSGYFRPLRTVECTFWIFPTPENPPAQLMNCVERVVAKGRRALGMLGRVLKGVSCEVKEKAYGTMVQPMLEYAAAVWDLYMEVEVLELEKAFLKLHKADLNNIRGLNFYYNIKLYASIIVACLIMVVCVGRVLAQVSCEVMVPKATRPNEGLLHINVELSPMGAPSFEIGRGSELAVQLNRLLEKCIKDSKCVDLESLCIIAEDKVWNLRIDIHVLNHEGSLVDAASIAALTALNHFRRPDVTMNGEQIVIHDPSERDPIPLTLHHQPVCITYAMFNTFCADHGMFCNTFELGEKKCWVYHTSSRNHFTECQMIWMFLDRESHEESVGELTLVLRITRHSELTLVSLLWYLGELTLDYQTLGLPNTRITRHKTLVELTLDYQILGELTLVLGLPDTRITRH
ncbi:hypothetical protein PR048_032999 [Dryococelus australis]|uniref:Exosome complex component RRP45 n=1 Tax=Dryococelus australis TaxID=614101 RepID=A0ABQ9G3V4_9NEOP|nr:hypothetical protein PR048_032999 [Dryococelus australis]